MDDLRGENEVLRRQLLDCRKKLEEAIIREFELADEIEELASGAKVRKIEEQNRKLIKLIKRMREELGMERAKLDFLTVGVGKKRRHK